MGGFSFLPVFSQPSDDLIDTLDSVKNIVLNSRSLPFFDSLINSELVLNTEDFSITVNSLIIKSRIAHFNNDEVAAVSTLLKAIEILDTSSNVVLKYEAFKRLAGIYNGVEDYEEAQKNYHKAMLLSLEIDSGEYIKTLSNYATLKYNIDELDSTSYFFDQAASYYLRNDPSSEHYVTLLGNIAVVKELNGDYTGSRRSYKEVIEIFKENNDIDGLITNWLNLGGNYADSEMYDSAEFYLMKAFVLSDSLKLTNDAMQVSENLSYMYEQMDQYKKALDYHQKFTDYKDSLNSSEALISIGSITKKFEIQIENDRIKRKEDQEKQRRERQANIQYFGAFLGILFFFIIVFFSGRIHLPKYAIDGIVFFAFVLLFEFLLVVLDPAIDSFSEGKPIFKLGCNVLLAVFIIPLHGLFEKRLKKHITK